ncbi:glycoside hydrolase family 3 protein [Sphingomonas sp. LT1P40]|uniref:glycoside hydrolase family 3 protein n=1 Tax=Alteristakelama amylovorans TaxID=3096166 RepID=UPI002FC6AAEE
MMRNPTWLYLLLSSACAVPVSAQERPLLLAPLTPEATANPEKWPAPAWPLPRDAAAEARIAALIARMTIEEKIGQIVQADIASITPAEAKTYHIGSILNGGNSAPGNDEFAPPEKWLALADAFYAASVDTSGGGVGIPIIWGTDAVHGHSNIVGATLFPHNVGLGAARDPDLIERIARATALEIRATGMEWTFAPTVTVPQDYRWGRAYEGYSSDPALVSEYVGRMVRGLQGPATGKDLLKGPYVIASTKHYLADGGTVDGRDQGDAQISEEVLRDIHGAPYVPALEQGVATIMVSFSGWNGVKNTGNKSLLTDLLKDHMGFDGFLVSDWNAHGQVAGCTNASCPQTVNAGLDMVMAPDSWKAMWTSLVAQAKDGTVPMTRIDDAVARILRVKMRLGLFEAGKPSSRPYAGQWDLLGAPDHRAIAREAVRKSLVLLKDQGGVLPIKPGSHILVAGDAADDIGRQSGGWTLTWQGTDVTNANFPGATSIWKGLDDAVKAAGGSTELAPDGGYRKKPDAAIVVFGETPYAEFQGDLKTLQLRPELRAPFATMQKLKAAGIPVIAVMISGRPLFMNPELNVADAFVAAWLPGSEGGGIADVLIAGKDGKPRFDFTGKLPTAWPATARAGGPVLFPFGYGMGLADRKAWTALSEDPGVDASDSGNIWFAKGVPAASWSLRVLDGTSDSTRITTVPAKALSGRVTVTATNHIVQEGARQFAISGGQATVEVSGFSPIELTRESNGDLLLVATMRVDQRPTKPATLVFNRTGIPFAALSTAPVGEWRSYGVPLKCFASKGADMARVETPFRLMTEGAVRFSLAEVRLASVADVTIPCP